MKLTKIKTLTRLDRGEVKDDNSPLVHLPGTVIQVPEKEAANLVEIEAAEYVVRRRQKEAAEENEKVKKDNAPKIPEELHRNRERST